MNSHFSRIKDVERLQDYDVIVIPTETDQRKKRFHLEPRSLARMGLSVGYYGRSDNHVDTVKRLISDETGKQRILYVHMTYKKPSYMEEIPVIGNCATRENLLPKIGRVHLHELPDFGPGTGSSPRIEDVNILMKKMIPLMAKEMSGLHGLLAFESHYASSSDYLVSRAHDIASEAEGTSLEDLVPTTYDYQEIIPDDEIEEFVSGSRIIEEYSHYPYGNKGCALHAPVKFIKELHDRGAEFYRPDEEFLKYMASVLVDKFMQEYWKRVNRIRNVTMRFSERLMTGILRLEDKLREAKNMSERMAMNTNEFRNGLIMEEKK